MFKNVKPSFAKIVTWGLLGIFGFLVLVLLVTPRVDAQSVSYSPTVDTVNTPTTEQNTNTSDPKSLCNTGNANADSICVGQMVGKAASGDATNNTVTEANTKFMSNIVGLNSILGPLPAPSQEQMQSEVWQRIYASIPNIDRLGLSGFVANQAVEAMFYSPVNIQQSTAFYAQNFVPQTIRENLTTQVYALGNAPSSKSAYKFLQPVIGSWWLAIFKLSTGLFVIVLVAAGIMVILRQKVGQSTVSIYMAIKNIVLGYVGAFLSFGIGSFFFNFSKWLMVVIAAMIYPITRNGFFGLGDKEIVYLNSPVKAASLFLLNLTQNSITATVSNVWETVKDFIHARVGAGLGDLFAIGIGTSLGAIIRLAIAIGVLVIFANLFIKVIKIYVSMLVDIILGPLIFLAGAIPGNESAITDWFKRMFKNSLKVPAMFFIVNLGFALTNLGVHSFDVISGGAIGMGPVAQKWVVQMGLVDLVPLIVISTANGVDGLIDQMFGGPSKAGATLSQGAKEALKKVPVLGGLAG